MGEIKSVKVDNWGVFFLQKLQNFFNKTDYCDLTLQFRDNSQLKVHRLVLSACTDFFNVLEQTCELIDDALVMPIELQADVVVPIVNFMYTGTLEFELKMYNKLLNTAREMNMTVLLKLLEAHKRTMETSKTGAHRSSSPRTKKANAPQISKVTSSPQTVSSTQQTNRSLLAVSNPGTPVRRKYTTIKQMMFKESLQKTAPIVHRGPTRFEAMDPNNAAEAYEPSFDSMSYESRPLKEEPEDYEELQPLPAKQRSSPFEQLRKGYHNNKRPAVTTFTSPPAKKPNIEDVKEFSEQQRMRKQIAAEYGDDAEYDGVMDDDIHNDDDDDEPSANQQSIKKQTQHQKEKQSQPQASIVIKQSPNEKPTIVVKDNSNSKMDHAKIISEVLRQYPHLVKSNKNIKLKIMPNVGGQPQKITVRKEDLEQNRAAVAAAQQKQPRLATNPKQATLTKVEAQTSVETVVAAATAASNVATNTASLPTPKRRIDSKTMHALIAQGAANTTGPWLCLRCGVNGRPISIPSYRGFRRHLINTHKETIDPALCEHCGWHSSNNRVLGHHLLVEHKIPSAQYKFPKCDHCTQICINEQDLDSHMEKVHPDEHKQQCIYCNKVFVKEMQLYNHMKTFHRKIAREDNVIDFSEDELADFEDEAAPSTVDKKIKIISDISLPSTILKLEEIPAAAVEEDYANDSGPKFVNADGNEMLLTAEQREEIMSQLDQDHDGGVVMVLNESAFPPGGESVVVGEESKIDSTENADVFSDHHIYSAFPTDAEGEAEFATGHDTSADESALDVSKGEEQEEIEEEVAAEHDESGHEERMDEDHMAWAQNLISAHDADDDENEEENDHMDDEEIEADEEPNAKKTTAKDSSVAEDDEDKVSSSKSPTDSTKDQKKDPKKEDDISLKLKMLTGDWSDDDIEDDEDDGEDNETPDSKLESNAELAATLTTDDTPEKPSTEVDEKQKEDTIKKEAESTPPANDEPAVEEEVSQSTQPEVAEEEEEQEEEDNDEKNKPKEATLEEDLSQEDLTKAKEPESKTSDTAIKEDVKEKESKKSSPATEKTKPRRTSDKEESVMLEVKKENISDDPIAEDPEESTSPKKSDDDHLADTELDKDKTKTKADSNSDKEDTVTSTEDSVKTVDKVKSLISEWADDDDDN